MKIESSQLALSNEYQFSREKVTKESLAEGVSRPGKRWSADTLQTGVIFKRHEVSLYNRQGFVSNSNIPTENASPRAFETLGSELGSLNSAFSTPQEVAEVESSSNSESGTQLDAKMLLMLTMVEIITGKKVKLFDTSELKPAGDTEISNTNTAAENIKTGEYGLRYHYSESTTEIETSNFSAQGTVITSDGRQIDIALELSMSRKFVEHFQVDIAQGAAKLKDPLVINFTGNSTQLRSDKIQFDIDADGKDDSISFVTSNSGFLAFDKNNDHEINDGSELFGALSGDGFAELAQYDKDNNQFIDEADAIYSKLQVWVMDNNGEQQLYSLADANVGAIYLGSADTPFEINTSSNEQLGAVRSSGIYLTEDVNVKTIQQLDLVV